MKYLSLFSGIEAATVAWQPLGWEPVAFAEIDKWASAVLAHRFPDVPNWGDVNDFQEWPDASVDIVVGGSPCQPFSVAGLRRALKDPRGQLTLTYLAVVEQYRPRWVVWENVPGVLSADGGRAFGAFIGGLAELGYGFAWRVLDAQYVRVDGFCRAVPQRRRRVFLVGHSGGSWQRAAEVLFERESLSGDPPPGRRTREKASGEIAHGVDACGVRGGRVTDSSDDGAAMPAVANVLTARMAKGVNTTLDEGQTPIAVNARQDPVCGDATGALDTDGGTWSVGVPSEGWRVRRLTPRECERLQGFPDDWTLVPGPDGRPMSDTQRYRMIGNSMAVNVMRWIGLRINNTGG